MYFSLLLLFFKISYLVANACGKLEVFGFDGAAKLDSKLGEYALSLKMLTSYGGHFGG